jgi:hypothetical protein
MRAKASSSIFGSLDQRPTWHCGAYPNSQTNEIAPPNVQLKEVGERTSEPQHLTYSDVTIVGVRSV